jgi:hypothetical protein
MIWSSSLDFVSTVVKISTSNSKWVKTGFHSSGSYLMFRFRRRRSHSGFRKCICRHIRIIRSVTYHHGTDLSYSCVSVNYSNNGSSNWYNGISSGFDAGASDQDRLCGLSLLVSLQTAMLAHPLAYSLVAAGNGRISWGGS